MEIDKEIEDIVEKKMDHMMPDFHNKNMVGS